jgi:tether containing UBX domain for GLUT4
VELPPSFFTLSAAELKIMIDSQKSKLNSLENRPLMTQAMREREQKLKEHKHPKCRIRVRFADRFTLEATFYSGSFGNLALPCFGL